MMIKIVNQENQITEESLTNDDVGNRKNKIQKSCITNRKHKKHTIRQYSQDSILPKMLKISSEATVNILQKLLNGSLETGTFPDSLKLADIAPIFKKKDPLNKTNYRLVSVLLIVSKLFEKIMKRQLNGFISNCLLPYLCGYRKGYNTL